MNQLKTVVLLGALSALLILLGGTVAPNYIWLFVVIAVAMNFFSYFYSDRIVLAMNRARPVDATQAPQLHRMVKDVAERAGIPMPRVYVIEDAAPNAFATGRNPAHGVVAVTTGIMQILSERELKGVIAHEMAHIRNRDILIASIAAMVATAISFTATIVQWGAIFGTGRDDEEGGGGIIGLLAMAIIAPIAATVIQLAISRSREYQADATGASFIRDPEALASALAKLHVGNQRVHLHTLGDNPSTASLFIVSPLSGRSMARWFSTHPPMEERIRRLRAMA